MKNLILLLLVFTSFYARRQVTGYWYGQANVEVASIQNNYLTELIISQKGNKVKGFFGYYFKDVYQSFVVKGSYDPNTRKLVINDIPIIYFKTNSTANSVDCITSFYGKIKVSKEMTLNKKQRCWWWPTELIGKKSQLTVREKHLLIKKTRL